MLKRSLATDEQIEGYYSYFYRLIGTEVTSDMLREADCIEEVARYYGMDRIEPVLPPVARSLDDVLTPESQYSFWQRIKRWGAGLGLNEAINYSFVGQKDLDALREACKALTQDVDAISDKAAAETSPPAEAA